MIEIPTLHAERVGIVAGMRTWDPELVDMLDTHLERAEQFNRTSIFIADELADALVEATRTAIVDVPPRTIEETGLDNPNYYGMESVRRALGRGLIRIIETQRLEQLVEKAA